jgi:hypothetical protein
LVRVSLSELSLIKDNKSQQKSTTQGGRDWSRHNKHQQKSTRINRVSKSQQKSAEIVAGTRGSQQKSAKVIKSQHFLLRFVNRVQCSSEPTERIGT